MKLKGKKNNWANTIKKVNELEENPLNVIDNSKSRIIKKMPVGKNERIEIELPKIYGMEVSFIAYRKIISKELKTAFYAIFNNQDNLVYTRELI